MTRLPERILPPVAERPWRSLVLWALAAGLVSGLAARADGVAQDDLDPDPSPWSQVRRGDGDLPSVEVGP